LNPCLAVDLKDKWRNIQRKQEKEQATLLNEAFEGDTENAAKRRRVDVTQD
jgi:hypothetical protein